MRQYFPPYRSYKENVRFKLHLSNYATKSDLKNVSHVDVNSFASKANLANLKTEVDRFDIDKLTPVPNDGAKLSNIVKNIEFVLRTKYEKNGSDSEKYIVMWIKRFLMLVAWLKIQISVLKLLK